VSVAAPHTSFSVIAVCAIALWFFGSAPGPSAQEKEVPEGHASGHAGAVGIQMRNVNFRLTDDIVLEVRTLRGQLQRTNAEIPVTFDDSASFTVEIDSAQVAITPASLTALMNS
jgi:hypothetical protein